MWAVDGILPLRKLWMFPAISAEIVWLYWIHYLPCTVLKDINGFIPQDFHETHRALKLSSFLGMIMHVLTLLIPSSHGIISLNMIHTKFKFERIHFIPSSTLNINLRFSYTKINLFIFPYDSIDYLIIFFIVYFHLGVSNMQGNSIHKYRISKIFME